MLMFIRYPKGMAQYVTDAQLQELGTKKASALERDSTFRSNTERRIEKQLEAEEKEREEAARPEPAPVIAEVFEPEPEPESEPQLEVELMSVSCSIYGRNQY